MNPFNRLDNGTEYRSTPVGYLLRKGKRRIFITAKSVNQGVRAKYIIANNSFNKIYTGKGCKRSGLCSQNERHLTIN